MGGVLGTLCDCFTPKQVRKEDSEAFAGAHEGVIPNPFLVKEDSLVKTYKVLGPIDVHY